MAPLAKRFFLSLSFVLVVGHSQLAIADNPLSPTQTEAVKKLIGKTLVENPEIIVDALRTLEARKKAIEDSRTQAVITKHADIIFNHPDDPVGGNVNGDVTLVEFFDYRCGYCKRVHPTVKRLITDDPKLRYVFKEFPILGEQSDFAARAALASVPQGKYQAFSGALMETKGELSEKTVLSVAKSVELDIARLREDMTNDAEAIGAIIRRNHILAKELNINGTPGFVIGSRVIHGAADYQTLKAAIGEARRNETKEK